MTNTLLGKTGIAVSPLCFGTLPFSPVQGYPSSSGKAPRGNQEQCALNRAAETLVYAFERGVNFLDTAQLYKNYGVVAKALELWARGAGTPVVVASKTYAHTREDALAAVEEARTALGRGVIDIFLLHEQESEHTLRGHAAALDALFDCKARGLIRAVGLSTHHAAGVWAAVGAGLDVVHPLLNIAGLGIADGSREDMEAAVRAAMNAGLGVYTMKALGGGHLFRRAEEALTYARQWGHCVALGMRDNAEVDADITFFETGKLPPVPQKPRRLHIADWCEGCGRCVAACKSGALEIRDGKAALKTNALPKDSQSSALPPENGRCVLCGYCGAKCPNFCLKIV